MIFIYALNKSLINFTLKLLLFWIYFIVLIRFKAISLNLFNNFLEDIILIILIFLILS